MFLPKMSKNMHILFAAMTHPAEELCLNKLLTLKVQNSLICLVGARIPTVFMIVTACSEFDSGQVTCDGHKLDFRLSIRFMCKERGLS
jgi:hypothetical protein